MPLNEFLVLFTYQILTSTTNKLQANGSSLVGAVVEVPVLPRVVQFRGSAAHPVSNIAVVGVNVSRTAPTYLESYECPSGGDWSIHRGGAVFLDGAVGITLVCSALFHAPLFTSRRSRNQLRKPWKSLLFLYQPVRKGVN